MTVKHPNQVLNLLYTKKPNKKLFAVLIDPDKASEQHLENLIKESLACDVDLFFVGGSLITSSHFNRVVLKLKSQTSIPVIIFPGSCLHIDPNADAILFLSLVSGRNPEYLIGQHIISAPLLKKTNLEIIPTAYLLIDGGKPTTVSYISGTNPIPFDKPEIAVSTALASEMLGLKVVYLDAGSGAINAVSEVMVSAVKQDINIPLIVGGGIDSAEKALKTWKAGADIIVVGTGPEKDFRLISELASVK